MRTSQRLRSPKRKEEVNRTPKKTDHDRSGGSIKKTPTKKQPVTSAKKTGTPSKKPSNMTPAKKTQVVQYEVDQILGDEEKDGVTYYKIKWKGYDL